MYLSAGALLQGGKYKIVRYISHGGFGCTYEAENTMFGERVVIKELFVGDFCGRGDTGSVTLLTESKRPLFEKLRGKFIDEARAIKKLSHPGIVKVFDAFYENGTAYYVMDYIEGESLKEVVKNRGALSEAEAVGYIRQVANALAYVHSMKRLHLDIKPGNVMLTPAGATVLIDFGVSKQYDEESGENTSTLMGYTVGYAPVEQMGNEVEEFLEATDIYALGATLYKLLTNVDPINANRVAGGATQPPLPAHISAATRRAVESAMIINRFNRLQSVADFLALLDGKAAAAADDEGTMPAQEATTPYTAANNKAADDGTLPANSPISSDEPRLDNNRNQVGGDSTIIAPKAALASQVSNTHEEEEDDDDDDDDDEPKRKLKWVWAAVAAVVLGIVGYIVVGGQGDSRPTNEDQISQETYNEDQISQETYNEDQISQETYNAQNGPKEYVDLGLPSGLKWATCNIGAYSPEEYGNYYAWGETTTKSEYTKENCQTFGENLSDISGNAQYDAAAENWGGSWRMPTKAEFKELQEYCVWQWTTQNGVEGYKVTSKTNGNSIFLPAAGDKDGSSQINAGWGVYYWSSTPDEDMTDVAYYLCFRFDGLNAGWRYRNCGHTVRPVFDGKGESEMTATTTTAAREAEAERQAEARRQEEARRRAAISGTIAGKDYVDLGLPSGLKWATCNVGASSPTGYGNYYAWGETSTKSEYTWNNSKTRYKNLGDISGNAQYDAARANWGGSWRMPTKAEFQELIDHCDWQWTTQNGVEGFKVTSKTNGNSIFLPAAGYYVSSQYNAGELGFYWSSTPREDGTDLAYYLGFISGDLNYGWDPRYHGRTVRPVSE